MKINIFKNILSFSLLIASIFTLIDAKASRIIRPRNPKDPKSLSSDDSVRVLVIGGGLAGMSAALELAERGFNVTLKDSRDHLGGRLDGFKVQPFKNQSKSVSSSSATSNNNDMTFNVEHGFHAWFYNYFNFDDILTRLNLHENFRPWEKVEYIFRKYKPESIYSTGPYPFNLLGILKRSPNLGLIDAIGTTFALPDLAFFNYDKVYDQYDHLSLKEWAQDKKANQKFYDIIMDPAISVTLNDRNISAADMLTLMQIYFLNDPNADKRRVATKPYNKAVIDPWVAKLTELGVDIQYNSPVAGLKFKRGMAYKEINGNQLYDYVILAADLPGQKRILEGSIAEDDESKDGLSKLQTTVSQLKVANPYKVLRIWFDKKLDPKYPDILETPEHRPINLVAQYHLLEDEYEAWSNATGGGVIEFHLYDINSQEIAVLESAEKVWEWIKPTAFEIYSDLKSFKPVGYNLNSFENFPSFAKGQHSIRPYVDSPVKSFGIKNLAFAGDWVQTTYPSFIMERAVSTGREAANFVLYSNGIQEVQLRVVSSGGPGVF